MIIPLFSLTDTTFISLSKATERLIVSGETLYMLTRVVRPVILLPSLKSLFKTLLAISIAIFM